MIYDSIVVGAGIEGSSTAYQFAKKGCNTLLIEQFPLPHSRGSSHGQSRIIRCAYEEDFFARMMLDAFGMWKELENETNTKIFKKTGVLIVQEPPHDAYRRFVQAIKVVNRPHEVLSGSELNDRFPGVRYDKDFKGMLELDGGLLRADKGLRSLQEQFVKYGGVLHDEERVMRVVPGDIITVITDKGSYKTRRLALAVGPWASQVLRPLGLNFPLEVQRINVCYWKEKQPGLFSKFPSFIDILGDGKDIYGLPSSEYPGLMKVCSHGGAPISTPEERDTCKYRGDIEEISEYIKRRMPGLECEPAIVETCMYTMTPDELPIFGTHPHHKNIAFICGLSGTGFKYGPVIGQLMYELLTGRPLSHDISHFTYQRFNKKATIHDTRPYGTVQDKTIEAKSKL